MSRQLLRLMIVCIITLLLLSCTAHYKLYEGATRLPSDVAILVRSPVSGLYLYDVDGEKAPDAKGMWKPWYGSKWNGGFSIELLPGEHTLSVAYNHQAFGDVGRYFSTQNQRITFDAQPGRIYTVMATIDKKNMRWEAWVAEIDSSSKGLGVPKESVETKQVQRGVSTEKPSQEQPQQNEVPNDSGTINITTDPPGAKIFIDGEFKGQTPTEISLTIGTHQLFLQRQLYEPYMDSLAIEKGQTKTLNIRLSQEDKVQKEKQLEGSITGLKIPANFFGKWISKENQEHFVIVKQDSITWARGDPDGPEDIEVSQCQLIEGGNKISFKVRHGVVLFDSSSGKTTRGSIPVIMSRSDEALLIKEEQSGETVRHPSGFALTPIGGGREYIFYKAN